MKIFPTGRAHRFLEKAKAIEPVNNKIRPDLIVHLRLNFALIDQLKKPLIPLNNP